jgi:RHS repeat-associated protein
MTQTWNQPTEATDYLTYGAQNELVTPTADQQAREKFTGKECDVEGSDPTLGLAGINLLYFGARYYDAEVGIFTSTDPAGQFWNSYSYCGGDPVNGTDPDGMDDPVIDEPVNDPNTAWVDPAYNIIVIGYKPNFLISALASLASNFKNLDMLLNLALNTAWNNGGYEYWASFAALSIIPTPGSAAVDITATARTADQVLGLSARFLGKNYEEIAPGVYRSASELRQFRMTSSDLAGRGMKGVPHVHFEWIDPATREVLKNYHVPLKVN